MNEKRPLPRQEKVGILSGILCIVVVLVVLQYWLLAATMNAFLGGDNVVVWPALVASLVCFALNAGLLRYLYLLEQDKP